MVEKIGSTPIGVLVLIALSLIVVRSASLVLEEGEPVKRQKRGKEIPMNAKMVVGSALETAWTITAGIAAGSLPPSP